MDRARRQGGYVALAWLAGEPKHFDLSLWLFVAIGALGMTFDVAPVPFLS